MAASAVENLSLQYPCGLQEEKGQKGKAEDGARGGSCPRGHVGLGVERAGSTHSFGTCFLSHQACSVTGLKEQTQVQPGVHPHRAHGRERWPLSEVIREGIKEEVVFGP